jgi:hypothetical protein
MEARDRPAALEIHVDLLTRGSQMDDIGLWMSRIEPLIMHAVVGKLDILCGFFPLKLNLTFCSSFLV